MTEDRRRPTFIPPESVSLPVAEVALKLKTPSWKIIRWIESGRLDGGRKYGRWWVTPESVERVAKELKS